MGKGNQSLQVGKNCENGESRIDLFYKNNNYNLEWSIISDDKGLHLDYVQGSIYPPYVYTLQNILKIPFHTIPEQYSPLTIETPYLPNMIGETTPLLGYDGTNIGTYTSAADQIENVQPWLPDINILSRIPFSTWIFKKTGFPGRGVVVEDMMNLSSDYCYIDNQGKPICIRYDYILWLIVAWIQNGGVPLLSLTKK
jgi:hypothetical protein